MKIPQRSENINSPADLRCVLMKAHQRTALNDLKKKIQDKETLNEYVKVLMSAPSHVTASIILKKLDSICSQYRTTNKTIVSWFTVELLNCEGVADAYIFLALKYLVTPETFEPFNFKRSGSEDNGARGSIALDNLLSANRLKRLRDKLNLVFSCQNIQIRVIEGLPKHTLNAEISSEFIAAAIDALHSSYDAATRTLNLSRFHAKPELGPHFCPLYVEKFLECVLHLILKKTPKVSKLILSDNYLCSLKAFSIIPNGMLAGLECLDISSNNIRDVVDLQFLVNLKLKNIILQGNGMAKLKLDEILTILPRLQNVQGCFQTQYKENVTMGLPNLKLFDSTEPNVRLFANNFIKHFYQFFDRPNHRSQLEQHYHEGATFSLSVPETMKQVCAYRLYNRNYKTTQSKFARSAKLQVGRNAVVHALGRLPKMETYLPGAAVDVQVLTSHVRIVTTTGHFMEHSPTGSDLRHFQRNFVLEQQESSDVWLIKNDMLCITPSIEENPINENIKAKEDMEQMSINNHGHKYPMIPSNAKSNEKSYDDMLKELMKMDSFTKESHSPVIDKAPIMHSKEMENELMPRLVPIPPSNSNNDKEIIPKPQIEVNLNDIKLEQEIDDTVFDNSEDDLLCISLDDDVLLCN